MKQRIRITERRPIPPTAIRARVRGFGAPLFAAMPPAYRRQARRSSGRAHLCVRCRHSSISDTPFSHSHRVPAQFPSRYIQPLSECERHAFRPSISYCVILPPTTATCHSLNSRVYCLRQYPRSIESPGVNGKRRDFGKSCVAIPSQLAAFICRSPQGHRRIRRIGHGHS